MAQPDASLARNSRLTMVRNGPKHKGTVIIVISILIGLILARFIMISPAAAVVALSCGIVLAVTLFLRRIDYLIFGWFVLTGLVLYILTRLLPSSYYPFVGRGIFWGLLICIIVARAIDNILSGRQFLRIYDVPLTATIVVFLLWCTASLFTSLDPVNSVKKLSHVVIGLVGSYIFYDFFSQDKNNINKVLAIIFFVAVGISSFVLVIAVQSLVSGVPIYKRISLWFINPNTIGYLLFMCIPISLAAGHYCVSNKGLKILFIAVMLLALFFSFHRTSWLAASVSIAILLGKSHMRIPMRTALLTGLFVASILVPVIAEDTYDYFTGERYTGRKEIWQAAWNTACDYPLFGTGPGNVLMVMPKYIETPYFKDQDTHSTYLKNAAEIGFPSVVFLLAVYATFFYSSWKIEKALNSDYLKWVTRGAVVSFWGLLIHGFLENGFFMTPFVAGEFHVMLPYILLSLPFAAKRLEERKSFTT